MRTFNRNLVQLGLAVTVMSVASSAMALTYVAADKSPETRICVSAAADNRMRFENKVMAAGIRMKVVADKLTCNGAPIQSFSEIAGNEQVSRYLDKHHPRKGQVEIHVGAAPVKNTDAVAVTQNEKAKADQRIIYVRGK